MTETTENVQAQYIRVGDRLVTFFPHWDPVRGVVLRALWFRVTEWRHDGRGSVDVNMVRLDKDTTLTVTFPLDAVVRRRLRGLHRAPWNVLPTNYRTVDRPVHARTLDRWWNGSAPLYYYSSRGLRHTSGAPLWRVKHGDRWIVAGLRYTTGRHSVNGPRWEIA